MSNIKINDVFQRIQYAATNGQTQFSIPFPFFDNAYVTVWQDGVVINQGAGAGEYGISGAGSPSGGLITLVTPAALNSIITIEGIMPIDRTSIYSATISNLTGSDLNGDFNREVVMMKQIQTTQALLQLQYAPWALVSQDETVTTDRYIPLLPPLGAWRMNVGGTAIETFLTPESGSLAPGDATYILQVADADLPNAQDMGSLASGLVVSTTTTGVQLTRLLAGVTNQTAITNASGLAGNPTVGIASNPTIPGTEYILFPSGTTAQRPVSPTDGMVRYNTDDQALEVYEGGTWDALAGGIVDSILGTLNQIGIDNTDPQNPIVYIANNPVMPGTGGITLPTGTTAQRGGILGTIRFNSQTLEFEGTTDGVAWNTFQTSAGTVLSVSGTANQINSTGGANPVLSLSSTANMPGTFNIQGTTAINAIINDSTLATATSSNIATAAAIKAYVDSLVVGLNIQGSCVCASTTALTVTYLNGVSGVGATLTNAGVQAAIQLDGVSPTVGQRVLIKNQASSLQNGIYTVTTVGSGITNWVLTRATDYDTAAEIQPGDLVILTGGTTQSQSSWVQTATVAAVGVDSISFVQFTASLPVNVASGGTGRTSATAYAPIVGGTTTTGAFQSVTLGASGTLFQSAGVGVLPGFTTTTYPVTNAINTIMYASSANILGVVAPTNNGVMVYSAGGVPSSSTTLPSALTIPLPRINGINDSNGNEIFTFASTASAINYFNIINSAIGVNPTIAAAGDDTNIGMILLTKGTGQFNLNSNNTTTPLLINSGTGLQHSTSFIFSNTAASRNVTFPDASGTVAFTSGTVTSITVQTFSSATTTTYTAPAGLLYADVYVTAGGGGGGGAQAGSAPQAAAAGGGGAGGTSIVYGMTAATIGASQSITIGAGGNGGTAGANDGSAGGASSFGAIITTNAGAGGKAGTSVSSASAPRLGGAGGAAGSGGSVNIAGGGGFMGVANGVSTLVCSGNGGNSFWGAGVVGVNTSAAGTAGTTYGSGGAGAAATVTTDRAGGAGAVGLIVVVEYKGV